MAKDNELKILDGKATTQFNEPKLAVKKKGLTLSEKLKQRAEDKKRKKAKKQNLKVMIPSEAEINNLLQYYNNGQYADAENLALSIIQEFPNHQFAWKVLGVVLEQTGRVSDSLVYSQKSVQLVPQDAEAHSNLGHVLRELGRLEEAEASYTQALALKPDFTEVLNNLGCILQTLGKLGDAEARYKQAIASKPDFALAHNNLGITLHELGRLNEAEASFRQALKIKSDFTEVYSNLGITLNAMGSKKSALKQFERSLQLKRGTTPVDLNNKIFRTISKAKIDHDIEQFEYLAASGCDIKKFRELATLYKTVSSEINCTLDTDILPLSDKHQHLLGDTYNRPIHILEAPALEKPAIGDSLDVNKITEDYFEHEFGLTYIDDFLRPTALESLRKFLLGSTIWFDFFHDGGYMGAYLNDGLASPLILQIADDLRKKLPKIFKNHQLTQLWAYKYDSRACEKNNSFTGIKAHADFAAVNVNFWITPKSANLDPSSGGLVVYNAEAPLEWDFKSYNNNDEKIREEILKCGQKKTIVPYNENRVVIFNSNLFHETDSIEFKDGYENRRINVTMLFGQRELKKANKASDFLNH
jgi:Flp pilus assembly protein TadD